MGTHLREHALKLAMRLAKRLDRRQPDPAELGSAAIRRILVVSCTAIGDTLMSTPAIRSLRLAYPHAHLTLLIHPAYRELFASLPGVNAMLGYRGGWKGFVRLALTLHRQSFDLAVILHGNEPQATPLAYLSGARWIFKLPNAGNPFQFLLSNREPQLRWEDFQHGIEQRLATAALAGGAPTDWAMDMPVGDHERLLVDDWLARQGVKPAQRVLGLQAGASTVSRRWPAGRLAELARRLLAADPQLAIVLTGSAAELPLIERIAADIANPRAIISAGAVPLAHLPALMARMSALVTPDTGALHLAVAVGTPVIALFAVSDWRRSGPAVALEKHTVIQKWRTCEPCLSKRCPYPEPPCMDLISVDEVEAACRQRLGLST